MKKNKPRQFACECITWAEVHRLSGILAQHIHASGYRPDLIIAIARGGYVPARLICDFLEIYDLTSIRITHYTAGSSKAETARLSSPLCVDIKGCKVLVVDDITDTGDSMRVGLDHIRSFAPAEVRVAVLQHKVQSSLRPDYYAKKLIKWRWIVYPWAIVEDIGGFLRAMENPPVSSNEISRILACEYGMKVSLQTLKKVQQAMKFHL